MMSQSFREYRPEIQLLLYCARTHLEHDLVKAVREICQCPLDWHDILQLAQLHGLMPLLYRSLSRVCPELVPETILQQLALYCKTNALRNQVLAAELLKILEILKANNIPVIPYKGPALAITIYRDLALRQFNDLDILVKKEDVLKAKVILCSNGFKPYADLTAKEEEHLLQSSYQYKFTHQAGKINLLELHWQVARSYRGKMNRFNPFDVNLAPIWKQLDAIALLDQSVPHFSPQDLFTLLCIHGAKERWRSLKSLCDRNELLRAYPEIDLHLALDQASNPEQYKVLSLTLVLLNALFGTPLPAEIVQHINRSSVLQLAIEVQKTLFSEADISSWWYRLGWHLQLIDGFPNQVRYAIWFLTDKMVHLSSRIDLRAIYSLLETWFYRLSLKPSQDGH